MGSSAAWRMTKEIERREAEASRRAMRDRVLIEALYECANALRFLCARYDDDRTPTHDDWHVAKETLVGLSRIE